MSTIVNPWDRPELPEGWGPTTIEKKKAPEPEPKEIKKPTIQYPEIPVRAAGNSPIITDSEENPKAPVNEEVATTTFQYEIIRKGTSTLKIILPENTTFYAESGAMVAFKGKVKIKAKMLGGLVSATLRKSLAGEKFFFQQYTTENGEGEIYLAPKFQGDISLIQIETAFYVQKDAFLGATAGVYVDTGMQGLLKGLTSGEGFFILKLTGKGLAFINAFGNLHKVTLGPSENMIVDNKHLVAWPAKMHYEVQAVTGILDTVTSGELLANRMHGPGDIYFQSHNPRASGGEDRESSG